jgi:hypothetical protein
MRGSSRRSMSGRDSRRRSRTQAQQPQRGALRAGSKQHAGRAPPRAPRPLTQQMQPSPHRRGRRITYVCSTQGQADLDRFIEYAGSTAADTLTQLFRRRRTGRPCTLRARALPASRCERGARRTCRRPSDEAQWSLGAGAICTPAEYFARPARSAQGKKTQRSGTASACVHYGAHSFVLDARSRTPAARMKQLGGLEAWISSLILRCVAATTPDCLVQPEAPLQREPLDMPRRRSGAGAPPLSSSRRREKLDALLALPCARSLITGAQTLVLCATHRAHPSWPNRQQHPDHLRQQQRQAPRPRPRC